MNGSPARALWSWMARATSSLPVPLSPVISTDTVDDAARPMAFHTASIVALEPTRSPSLAPAARRAATLRAPPAPLTARAQRLDQPIEIERLGEVVEGAELHRLDGALAVAVGRGHDHRQARGARCEAPRAARGRSHPSSRISSSTPSTPPRPISARAWTYPLGGARLEAGGLDRADQAVADHALVVDDEDRGHGTGDHHGGSARERGG